MATKANANLCRIDENICQGDVFKDVKYYYLGDEDNDSVELVEFVFPMAVIISQGCDVVSMGEMELSKQGKATKFMPSILMCPIYDEENAKFANHLTPVFEELEIIKMDKPNIALFNGKELDIVRKDWHYRYHELTVAIRNKTVLDKAIIDFKHYFSVPASYLIQNRENRLFHLDDLFAEQVTLKYATFLSRVAIPDEPEEA